MIVAVEDRVARASKIRRHLAARFAQEGRPYPEWCAALVTARADATLDIDGAASALGCDADLLLRVERGDVPAWSAPAAVRRWLWSQPERSSRIRGCLLGGAVGDALGAAVEFDSLPAIRAATGGAGVDGYRRAYGRTGAVTDDTQMALFTAEGLLRAWPGDDPVPSVHRAYLRWLATQRSDLAAIDDDSWLLGHRFLWHQRAPGVTCLSALSSGPMGTIERPRNDSKGCGGVMRAAPAGMMGLDRREAFELGARVAAITHGHPSGYLPAGVLASVITLVMTGVALDDAIVGAADELRCWEGHEETAGAVEAAIARARDGGPPTPEAVEQLGAGWTGEEALAISVYCALAGGDYRTAVLAAVNHSGDSDSTGSITGNLAGAALGADLIPPAWLAGLEGRDVIDAVAGDLADGGTSHPERWRIG